MIRVFKKLVVVGLKYQSHLILKKIIKMPEQPFDQIIWDAVFTLAMAIKNIPNYNPDGLANCELEINNLDQIMEDKRGIILLRKLLKLSEKIIQYEKEISGKNKLIKEN